jgi:hypothetical protein
LLVKVRGAQMIKKVLVLYKIAKLSHTGKSLPVEPKLDWPTYNRLSLTEVHKINLNSNFLSFSYYN